MAVWRSGHWAQGFVDVRQGLRIIRPQSSSVLGLPYRILNMNPQKELLWGLWVSQRSIGTSGVRFRAFGLVDLDIILNPKPIRVSDAGSESS